MSEMREGERQEGRGERRDALTAGVGAAGSGDRTAEPRLRARAALQARLRRHARAEQPQEHLQAAGDAEQPRADRGDGARAPSRSPRATGCPSPSYRVTARGQARLRRLARRPAGARARAAAHVRPPVRDAPARGGARGARRATKRECLRQEEEGKRGGESEASAEEIAGRLEREDERLAMEVRVSWLEYARRELRRRDRADGDQDAP